MEELQLHIPVTRTIPAIDPWYGTQLLLRKEGVYRFEVLPPEQTWIDGPKLDPFTADGRTMPFYFWMKPVFRMPMVKWFALIGCIDRKRSSYFKIGTYKDNYSPEKDGELICFANDALGFNDFFYRHNNEGAITLTITRIA